MRVANEGEPARQVVGLKPTMARWQAEAQGACPATTRVIRHPGCCCDRSITIPPRVVESDSTERVHVHD